MKIRSCKILGYILSGFDIFFGANFTSRLYRRGLINCGVDRSFFVKTAYTGYFSTFVEFYGNGIYDLAAKIFYLV